MSCAACGQAREELELLRFVFTPPSGWLLDERARLPGREVRVHADRSCLLGLEREPAKAGLANVEADSIPGLLGIVLANTLRAVQRALSQCAAGGAVVGGHDVLTEELTGGRIAFVLCAADAAPRTLRSLRRAAPDGVAFRTLPLSRAELGGLVGQPPRAAVGVADTRRNQPLTKQLTRWSRLDPAGSRAEGDD